MVVPQIALSNIRPMKRMFELFEAFKVGSILGSARKGLLAKVSLFARLALIAACIARTQDPGE